MAIDFTKPVTTDNYSTVLLPGLVAAHTAIAQLLDSTQTTITGTPPTYAKRYNRTSSALEEWNGSAWVGMPLQGINFLSGKIGLGVTSPAYKLDVNTTDDTASIPTARIGGERPFYLQPGTGGSALYGPVFGLGGYVNTNADQFHKPAASNMNGMAAIAGAHAGDIEFFAHSAGTLAAVTTSLAAARRMVLKGATGQLLLNRTTDSGFGLLQIADTTGSIADLASSAAGTSIARVRNTGAQITGLAVQNSATGTTSASGLRLLIDASGVAFLNQEGASSLNLGTNGSTRLSIASGGLVTASVGLAGPGSGITGLNASNLASGTVPNARTTGATAATANTLALRDANGDSAVRGLTLGNTAIAGANVLDWYEEGSFTPTVTGASVAGTASSYPTQVGRYVRMGRLVYVEIELQWSGHTGSGIARIQGLPFAAARDSYTLSAFAYSPSKPYTWRGVTTAGQTYLQLYGIEPSTGGNDNELVSAADGPWRLYGFYEV